MVRGASFGGTDEQTDRFIRERNWEIRTHQQKGSVVADFACKVVEVTVTEHPNADRLEIANIQGYQTVVGKGAFTTGDLAVYLPEGSVLPDSLIEELGLVGRLAGKASNRVKAVRLRGVVSQGLLVPLSSPHLSGVEEVLVGDDLTEPLAVTKWVPPIPTQMQGIAVPCTWTNGFDVESWQSYPHVMQAGEAVHITEKVHGTLCLLACHPEHGPAVASKGMLGKSCFDLEAPDNDRNLYVRAWHKHGDALQRWCDANAAPIQVLGEIVGPQVQDLHYGLSEQTFLGFAVRCGYAKLTPSEAFATLNTLDIPTVPVLADNTPFVHEDVLELAREPSALGGGLREGVVVASVVLRSDPELGAARVKYVNPDYLTRSGGSEHN